MSKFKRFRAHRKSIADLIYKDGRVALHALAKKEPVRASNRLVELPVDESLGGEDPNFRLICALQVAAQSEFDRQSLIAG